MFAVDTIRRDFPILSKMVNGRSLIYFDNAATTQLPTAVLACMDQQYREFQANVHRGVHTLSEESTFRMEEAREKIRAFIHAKHTCEIIFTSGTTASINLAARSLEEGGLLTGDIITTCMEHHSNLIPWQQVCKRQGTRLHVIPIMETGQLDMCHFRQVLTDNHVSLIAITAASNVTGITNPIKDICLAAHNSGALVLVDAAQYIRHGKTDVQELDCDLMCFSGHKMLAPTDTGILYGKEELLEKMPPVFFGGGMVDEVFTHSASWDALPYKLEAGTPNIVGNIAFGAAIDYLETTGIDHIGAYEAELVGKIQQEMSKREYISVIGQGTNKVGSVSFTMDNVHPFDAAKLLDQLGIAVRSGHHCAQPLLRAFGKDGCIRVSPAFYNTADEIERFFDAISRIHNLIG